MSEQKAYSIIKESFTQYAGAVLQSRALVDVRDCMKPSARQIFYCLYTDKITHDKPFKKTLKCIGSSARMYIHGDASCEGVIMRAGQPFSMRYPLVEVEGAYGNLMESGNWSAPRYTSSRLSELSSYLFKDIQKKTIDEWRDNYDDTEKYPTVLPTKGYYNICNPIMGIGVGAAASIPGFNIKDVNKALIYLLKNPDCDFEDIYCAPDFPTGGILLNENDVKESLKNGRGKSALIRSVVEYDTDAHCLVVKEIPYGVYTNTICRELEELINSDPNSGIERFNDLTGGSGVNIKIYLSKRANPERVLSKLFKETSLQSYYSINMVMLDMGRFPKLFTWKQALQAHIDHEKEVYRHGFEFDKEKAENRLHIVEGILIAIANIEEVIKTIKESSSSIEANKNLQLNFKLTEVQSKAILEIKLARLAHLEVEKYEKEKKELENTISHINRILSDKELFEQQLIDGWEDVAKKFGDARRTKIMNLDSDDDEMPIEKKQLVIHLTNQNSIYAYEDTTLIASRKGRGSKVKLNNNELIIHTVKDSNYENLLMFSSLGKVYSIPMKDIPLSQHTSLISLLELSPNEVITSMVSDSDKEMGNQVLFITKNGIVKRTPLKEYKTNRSKGLIAIKLSDDDLIKKVMIVNDNDDLSIATKNGYFIWFKVSEIPSTGRNTKGVKGITLRENDEVCDASIITPKTKQIISITKKGLIKKTDISAFTIGSRTNKGMVIHKLSDGDELVNIRDINETDKAVSVSSTGAILKFSLNEVRLSDRNTLGTLSINLKDNQYVTGMIIE